MKRIIVDHKTPPTISYDPTVRAVYIKFSDAAIAKTVDDSADGLIVAFDVDSGGGVVGVELVGMSSFSVRGLESALKPKVDDMPDLSAAEISLEAV